MSESSDAFVSDRSTRDARVLVRHAPSVDATAMTEPGLYASPQTPSSQRSWGELARGVLAHKRTVLIVAVLLAIGPIIALWTLKAPQYEAYGQVRVRPMVPFLVFRTEDNGIVPHYQAFLNTQVGLIRSPVVIQRALENPDVQATRWYQKESRTLLGHRKGHLERLRESLSVWPRIGTELIDVSLTTDMPADAAVIINAVLDAYMAYVEEHTDASAKEVLEQLVSEFKVLDTDIRNRRAVIERLGKQLGTSDPEELVIRQRLRVDESEAELAAMKRALLLARRRAADAKQRLNDKAGQAPPETPDDDLQRRALFSSDPEWRRLRQQVNEARHEVALLSERLGKAHPRLIGSVREVAYAEKLLAQREEELQRMTPVALAAMHQASPDRQPVYLSPETELQELSREIALREYEYELLSKDYETQREHWVRTFDAAQMLVAEQEEMRRKIAIQDAVRTRIEQKRMETNVPGAVEVLSRAIVPDAPRRDQRPLLTGLVLFAATLAGVGVAYLRAGANPLVSQAEDFTAASVPFLGHMPRIAARDRAEVLHEPLLHERARMIRTPLLLRLRQSRNRVLLITSAEQGAGKTTLAILLARSFAQCGKTVLLVDGDLRRPQIRHDLHVPGRGGLAEGLANHLGNAEMIKPSGYPRLSVIPGEVPAGGVDPEIIANGLFAKAVKRWSQAFDLVILDSPPVLAAADAQILAQHAAGVLFAVCPGRSRRSDVIEAMASLQTAGSNLWGAVFINGYSLRSLGGAYTYAYESSLQQQEVSA